MTNQADVQARWRLVQGAVGFLDFQYYHGDGYWDVAEVIEGSELEAALKALIAEETASATAALEEAERALERIGCLRSEPCRVEGDKRRPCDRCAALARIAALKGSE